MAKTPARRGPSIVLLLVWVLCPICFFVWLHRFLQATLVTPDEPQGAAFLMPARPRHREDSSNAAVTEVVRPVVNQGRDSSSDTGPGTLPSGASTDSDTAAFRLSIGDFEDNSNRKGPEPGDFEIHSTSPLILPGADDNHLHGLLGLGTDGFPLIKPTPVPEQMDEAFLKESHRGFCFNSAFSDSLPLDRVQTDVRSPQCLQRHLVYPADLPAASIIMIFHNENLSVLLRSVHSVLNLTPPRLLREVILVDDSSHADPERFYEKHFKRLQGELEGYCKGLPKVRLVRLKRRRGLMVARMEGAWRARGDALVFLDSHIEATPGWIEPMLARIKEGAQHVVVPSIDGIDNHDFTYQKGAGLGILHFSWSLGQKPVASATDDPTPIASPVMAGGLFAAHRAHFLYLGGYDQEMQLYAGEEMEMGFRTWMCGGTLELLPCSHVGHVFRTPAHWVGQVYKVPGEAIAWNKLRTAEVWMDQYKDLVKLSMTLPDIGPLEERRQLRDKLHCRSFQWYLENVATWLRAPKFSQRAHTGSLMNIAKHACIDSFNAKHVDDEFGAYPCHGLHGSQAILLDDDGYLMQADSGFVLCLAALPSGPFSIQDCQESYRWAWDEHTTLSGTGMLRQPSSGKCLALEARPNPRSPVHLALRPCSSADSEQAWRWGE